MALGSSAATVGESGDLLVEIFLLLPAKTLVRSKLVSKYWCSLISSPSFSLLHLRRHPQPRQSSFILGATNSQFFICNPTVKKLIPFSFPFPCVKILQSCNGLLLLECGDKELHVFNPTTMQSRNLFLDRAYSGLCLIFDPSKSHHYRVVCLTTVDNPTRFWSDRSSTSFVVYDSETPKWSDGGKCDHGPPKIFDGVYSNSCVYFIRNALIFQAPAPVTGYSEPYRYIIGSNGHLHRLSRFCRPDMDYIYLLQMCDNNTWLDKCCRISWYPDKFRRNNTGTEMDLRRNNTGTEMDLLGLIKGETTTTMVVDSTLLYHVPGKILTYRFSDQVSEVLVDFTSDCFYNEGQLQFGFNDAHPFIQNLAPV